MQKDKKLRVETTFGPLFVFLIPNYYYMQLIEYYERSVAMRRKGAWATFPTRQNREEEVWKVSGWSLRVYKNNLKQQGKP